MSTTLQQAFTVIKSLEKPTKGVKKSIAKELLGKYKGVTSTGKTSTELIKELRASLYGKAK